MYIGCCKRISFKTWPHDNCLAARWQHLRLMQARLMEIVDPAERAAMAYVIKRLEAELADESKEQLSGVKPEVPAAR